MTRFAAALLIVCAAACSKKAKPAADDAAAAVVSDAAPARSAQIEQTLIADVAIREVSNPRQYDLYAEQLAKHLGRDLAGSGVFFVLPNDTDPMRPARRANVVIAVSLDLVEAGSSGKASLVAAVEGTVTWVDGTEVYLRENLVGEQAVGDRAPGDVPKIAAGHVARVADEIVAGLVAQEKLRVGPMAGLVAALGKGDDEPNLLRFALGQVGVRDIHGALPLAARHLRSKHPEVRAQAMAALVRLKDPAAVDHLTRAAEFDDYAAMRAVVEAVGAIGGDDAAEYLEFVASGHPDDGIKKRAKEALTRVSGR